MDKVRKEVRLSKQTVRELKVVAGLSAKSPKKYIEELIIENIKSQIAKINGTKDPKRPAPTKSSNEGI
jgi:hypothetical protein